MPDAARTMDSPTHFLNHRDISRTTESVALAHDYLLVLRGAERTFSAMAACWPSAPIYTLLCEAETMAPAFRGHEIRSSYLQHTKVTQRSFRRLLPLFPRAAERLPVQEHDLIVSSSSAFAHRLRPAPGAIHVCYCHSPFRYAWHERDRALEEAPRPLSPMLRRTLASIRRSDRDAAARIDHIVANSAITRERIRDFWGRDAEIVHPPVDVQRFGIGTPEDFLLVVGEVVRHKRVELALEAARLARQPIVVVGEGPELPRLREEYGATATFLGRVRDEDLVDLYRRCRALVVPNVEEFGIAAVEAMASGRPVIGADAGGLRETVIPGLTGTLVPVGDVRAFADAMTDPALDRMAPAYIREHAQCFSTLAFQRHLLEQVDQALGRQAPDVAVASPALAA